MEDSMSSAAYHRAYYLAHSTHPRMIPGATRASKMCRKCGITKSRSEYTVRASGPSIGHLVSYCKTCSAAITKAKYNADTNHYQRYGRPSKLRRHYGMTVQEYDSMLAGQGGGCAICGSQTPKSRGYKRARSSAFCVDHDHKTGRVRGLLCTCCNRAIGLIYDNTATAENMVRYLAQKEI